VVVPPLWAAALAEDALPGQRLSLQGMQASVYQLQANSQGSAGAAGRAPCCEMSIAAIQT
jgi:hypothetical protein